MEVRKASDNKSDLPGHSRSLVFVTHIAHIWFSISLPLQVELYVCLVPFPSIISYFSKFKEVMWFWTHCLRAGGGIYHVCTGRPTHQHQPAHAYDMIGDPKFKNGSRDPDHAPFRVICHPKTDTWYSQSAHKIWTLFQRCDCGRKIDHASFRDGLLSIGLDLAKFEDSPDVTKIWKTTPNVEFEMVWLRLGHSKSLEIALFDRTHPSSH